MPLVKPGMTLCGKHVGIGLRIKTIFLKRYVLTGNEFSVYKY
jgi:hypothetical protein